MRFFYILIFIITGYCSFAQDSVEIRFENYANGKPVVLNTGMYKNVFGEEYSVSKLKYYISNIHLVTDSTDDLNPNVFLVNAADDASVQFRIPKPSNQVKGISFLIGVDSALNCSGAQSGALDPLNDMFWTWNSGYVMFKLEGKSVSSKADNNRIEQHIGGYKGEYKTMRQVYIPLDYHYGSPLKLIIIKTDLDKFWKGITGNRIAENPVNTVPGEKAKLTADNFPGMFSLQSTCCFEQ